MTWLLGLTTRATQGYLAGGVGFPLGAQIAVLLGTPLAVEYRPPLYLVGSMRVGVWGVGYWELGASSPPHPLVYIKSVCFCFSPSPSLSLPLSLSGPFSP